MLPVKPAHRHAAQSMNAPLAKTLSLAGSLTIMALIGGLMFRHLAAQDAGVHTSPTPGPTAALPAGILPQSPLAQVIKLSQAGVDDSIIQAFITNSAATFNLNSDEIIYLKDTGVPNELVKEMLERDSFLQAQMAAASQPATPPTPPAPTTPTTPTTPTLVATTPPPDDVAAGPQPDITIDDFYTRLAPFGNWVAIDGYGECWQPGVATYNSAWQPYGDNGHWVSTDNGWYWVSDYSWGWAPFHYGRWFHDDHYGWCWYPDTVWGPSWVVWRSDDEYCGWAPLPPGAVYTDGIGLVYNGAVVSVGFDFGLSLDSYIFVSLNDFCGPQPIRHRLDPGLAVQIYHRSTLITRYERNGHGIINPGIDPGRITLATHTPIQTLPIHTGTTRFSVGEPTARTGGTVDLNRQSPAPDRTSQPNYWQPQERTPAPVASQNDHYRQPIEIQRPAAPVENNRSFNTLPETRLEPVPQPEPVPVPETRPQRIEPPTPQFPQTAPAHNNSSAEPSAASSSTRQPNKYGN